MPGGGCAGSKDVGKSFPNMKIEVIEEPFCSCSNLSARSTTSGLWCGLCRECLLGVENGEKGVLRTILMRKAASRMRFGNLRAALRGWEYRLCREREGEKTVLNRFARASV